MYANQEAVIMLMLLLVFIYDFLYKNQKSIFYITILMLSMLMLGTRVASVGGFLTIICAYVFYIIYCLYKKKQFDLKSLFLVIPIVIWGLLLPISPYANRNIELNNIPEEVSLAIGVAVSMENTTYEKLYEKDYHYLYIETKE